MKPRYLTRVDQIDALNAEDKAPLRKVEDMFAFRSNEYYLSLIDWNDPTDPIRRIAIPDPMELEDQGVLDPSQEKNYTVVRGIQHKYRETALLLVSDVCGSFCRFCFRKRLFIERGAEVTRDVTEELAYIRDHSEITNVLLTGGDPLIMSTSKLEPIVRAVREIEHVRIIRIGSKMPAFNPFRIIEDPALLEMIRRYSTPEKRIYIMAQFNHPRELTSRALEALSLLMEAGAVVVNQTPLLRGINDDPEVLAKLFKKLSFIGVPPYYVFQCRPTRGNGMFQVPVEETYEIFEEAKAQVSGLAKRAKLVMSHVSGKIEIAGLTDDCIYFKYHQAADSANIGRFMAFKRNPAALWFDDYTEPVNDRADLPGLTCPI
ncbi:KamA family radical SAM protein [Methanofollis aquaemaris]|uniref:KamA family radical SAM protein n=1 Tax=Methanofollis aquaemaris TaxID=126734 RepID=A0A8A3S737_9EURY|nr:KamA family radical SAM protein [Methanofollis aquaemaris]QSZ67753.1 KamA family radical SAM protein [Methanofollis aquaemaris]